VESPFGRPFGDPEQPRDLGDRALLHVVQDEDRPAVSIEPREGEPDEVDLRDRLAGTGAVRGHVHHGAVRIDRELPDRRALPATPACPDRR
jgi:hypothetical protein